MPKSHNNQELFSNYYLEERLPERNTWQEPEGLTEAYGEISELYHERKSFLKATKEAQTEEEWIKPILKTLGFKYITQPSESIFNTTKVPDYAFFLNDDNKRKAYKAAEDNKKNLFNFALAVGDAKRWGRNLNELSPNKQIDEYLRITDSRWGILTNGRLWRIYHLDSSYRLDTYYEVDLVDLIESEDQEKFKYFYLFFRPRSFVEDGFLSEVYDRSEDFTASVSEDLKENAFDALRELCQGFLSGNPELGEEDLGDIYENSLVLLYRLIFLLYAESEEEENLLPMDNETYRKSHSLEALKKKVVEKKKNNESLLSSSHRYWGWLKELFSFIDKGEETLGVYEYNGGLFDSKKHQFLDEKYKIGNKYIGEAIRKVSYSEAEGGFIDYQDLDVRELGAIYEGLLEHKPIVEEEKVKWEEDLSERKETGSYYTPEYIVKYIVENTISPLVKEKREEIEEGLEKQLNGSGGDDIEIDQRKLKEKREEVREKVLDLKVLDPAMGSGHFLVEATEKLANSIASLEEELFPEEQQGGTTQEAERKDSVKELKRQIVERSIYGVDKNPLATELAKLSLWLHTVAKGEPLSFLDHHLRTGNSLIGIDIEEMKAMPSEREQMAGLFTSNLVQDLGRAIGHLSLIEEITSGSRDDVQEKKSEWRDIRSWIEKYKKAANVRLSTSFGNNVNDDEYRAVLQAAANDDIDAVKSEQFFQKAQMIAESRSFFHWELEFPDIFRNREGKELRNSGFDAIVGNPPWVFTRGQNFSKEYKEYFTSYLKSQSVETEERGLNIQTGKVNLYSLFYVKCIALQKYGSNFGFIVPNNLLRSTPYSPIRKYILDNTKIRQIVNLGEGVFEKVTASTVITVLERKKNIHKDKTKIIIGKDSLENNREERTRYLKQSSFEENVNYTFNILLTEKESGLVKKIRRKSSPLGSFCKYMIEGVVGSKERDVFEKKKDETFKKFLDGGDIERYGYDFKDRYLRYHRDKLHRARPKEVFESEAKIIVQRISGGEKPLVATLDRKQHYTYASTNNVILKEDTDVTYEFIVALLNSTLINWYYSINFTNLSNLTVNISKTFLEKIPVPSLNHDENQKIQKSVKNILEIKNKKRGLNLNIEDYLTHYSDGKPLGEICTPVEGLSDTILTRTSSDLNGLMIGGVECKEKGTNLVIQISMRYKPEEEQSQETDRWGYTGTDAIPAMKTSGDENIQELIKEFVPLAINKASGFANFRENATKTISPIKRLEKLTLPKLEDVESVLGKYLEKKEKAEKLEEEIQESNHQIDAIVFDLYDLDEDGVRTVLDSLETPEDEKSDIMYKFRQVSRL